MKDQILPPKTEIFGLALQRHLDKRAAAIWKELKDGTTP